MISEKLQHNNHVTLTAPPREASAPHAIYHAIENATRLYHQALPATTPGYFKHMRFVLKAILNG